MLSEIRLDESPFDDMVNCTFITEDGEWFSFWSADKLEAAHRARWIIFAWFSETILSDETEF